MPSTPKTTASAFPAPAARGDPACGGLACGLAPARRTGFTLIEVLVAMAIFAIGFAMVAGVIPAGHILNKRTEDDVLAIVAAKNVVAVIEAKKVYVPAWEFFYMHDQINEGAFPNGTMSAPGTQPDFQASARAGEAKSLGGSMLGFRTSGGLQPYDNRPNDGDKMFDFEDYATYQSGSGGGDGFPAGGYVGYTDNAGNSMSGNQCRGWYYATNGFCTALDTNNDNRWFSASSSSPAGNFGTPNTASPGNPGSDVSNFSYADCTDLALGRIHAFHHRVGYADVFPSEDITYPTYVSALSSRDYLSCVVVADLNADAKNRRWVAAVAVMRRHEGDSWPERGNNPSLGGCATGAQGASFPRLVTPNNPAGLKSADTGQTHPNSGWPITWGYWNTYAVSGNDTDPSIPGLYNLPAIVYDYSRDLVEVAYPPCWTPGAYTPFVDASVDRRMAAGDKFIAREGGTIFTVLSTSDLGADKRYQLLKVYPPLRTTLLGPNADPHWRLREVYFSPRPAAGGASPLVRIETLSADRGFTTNTNH